MVAGYNIINGTNFTVGIYGTIWARNERCTTSQYGSALSSDCDNLVSSITPSQVFTQISSDGCSQVLTNGTCSANFCDLKGSAISSAEYSTYLDYLLYECGSSSGYVGGESQLSVSRNISLYRTPSTYTASIRPAKTVCQTLDQTFLVGPSQADCQYASTAIPAKYGSTIVLPSSGAACLTTYTNASCQVEVCGQKGQTLTTNSLVTAISNVTSTCQASGSSYSCVL